MKIELTKRIKTMVVFTLFVCYFLLLAPYIVHTNLSEVDTGIVIDLKTIPTNSLPKDVQDVIFSEESTILLVEDTISGIKKAVIIEKSPHSSAIYKGDVIKVTDKIIEWHVDWRAYNFFGLRFNRLIIGDVEEVDAAEAFFEELLYTPPGSSIPLGSLIFALSQFVFFIAPPLLILYTSVLVKKHFYLWNLTAILALYSLEVFIFNMVGAVHHITISDTAKYFGYLFAALLPSTFFLAKYEGREEGQMRLRKVYDKIIGREGPKRF